MTVRAAQATRSGQIETWYVLSSESDQEYSIHYKHHPLIGAHVWTCNCPDFTERRQWSGENCKHIEEAQTARAEVPSMRERGAAKYDDRNWRLMPYPLARALRENKAIESKLESVLESLASLLQEIRQ